MPEDRIKRKDLWVSLDKITQKDWERAVGILNLIFSYKGGKGSHAVIRDPKYPEPSDTRGLISTVVKDCYKQANQGIFKNLLDFRIEEDAIWEALGML